MRAGLVSVIIATLAVVVSASPLTTRSAYVVHESRSRGAHNWSKRSRVPEAAVIPVRIGLAQQNLHRAEEFINQVSDPSSPDYGKHWTAKQVAETFAPSKESLEAVSEWLQYSGIEASRIALSAGRNWLSFNATTRELEDLIQAKYHVYSHISGHQHIACEKYSIPAHLLDHIDIITPTVDFDKKVGDHRRKQHHQPLPLELRKLNRRQDNPSGLNRAHAKLGSPQDGSNPKQGASVVNALMTLDDCDTMITPDCLRALYNFPPGSTAVQNNTMAITEYTPQAFLQTDLDMWFKQFVPNLQGTGPNQKLVDGAIVQTINKSFTFNGESALDLQYGMALIYPQLVDLFQVGDLVAGGSFNNFLDAIDASYCTFMGGDSKDPSLDGQYPNTQPGGFTGNLECGTSRPNNVISTSYSANEADLTSKYMNRQCAEYMKLGLQGVSVLYSSGDFGVAGNGGVCIDPVTGAYNNGSSGIFNPSFPGTCPYITSVGATQVNNGSSVRTPESAAETVIFSGGGFSNVFAMPSYQKAAVTNYFANHAPAYGADRFNNSKVVRGFPDVSANGVNYVTAVDGKFSLTFGTSASCPTFAALLTLVNEKRIAANKSPVGFVNPALYAAPAGVMNDIQNGGNQGCGTKGFSAVSGWDPLTGLGTPNYPQMLDMFMKLP